MRSFYARLFKNLIGVYLCVLGCFAYITMMNAIPGHVYLEEGESLALDRMIPVSLAVQDDTRSVMSDIGEKTYRELKSQKPDAAVQQLAKGSHDVVCYLFGVFPIKEVEVSVVESRQVQAAGRVVGIYGATNGVLVLGSSPVETVDGSYREPAEHIVFAGDYITAVNGKTISEKEQLIEQVNETGANKMTLTVWRNGTSVDVALTPVETKEAYMLGLWVKDDMAGIGTLTYYDKDGNFGALGHGIGDGETGELLRISKGNLYRADIFGIKKGKRGEPGELQGIVYYGTSDRLGTVDCNTDIGIYGTLNDAAYEKYCKTDERYLVGYKQDVQTGDAVILSDASGQPCVYHIVIDSMDYSPADRNKGLRFHVDDKNLLELTGGIVQGLSGSPIIQNGKIVGGVTHVLVNDPTRGYGIFVEEMLEH